LRNPVEAWPAELLFFFRVTLLLRGLCSKLEASPILLLLLLGIVSLSVR
jgi:hypothetical protein